MQHIIDMAKTFNEVSEACGVEPVFTEPVFTEEDKEEREHNAREAYWYAHPEARA